MADPGAVRDFGSLYIRVPIESDEAMCAVGVRPLDWAKIDTREEDPVFGFREATTEEIEAAYHSLGTQEPDPRLAMARAYAEACRQILETIKDCPEELLAIQEWES